jgi:hypothetical protein
MVWLRGRPERYDNPESADTQELGRDGGFWKPYDSEMAFLQSSAACFVVCQSVPGIPGTASAAARQIG